MAVITGEMITAVEPEVVGTLDGVAGQEFLSHDDAERAAPVADGSA